MLLSARDMQDTRRLSELATISAQQPYDNQLSDNNDADPVTTATSETLVT